MAAAGAAVSAHKERLVQLEALTSVRFVAAFTVLIFHFGGDAIAHLPRTAQLIFEHGYVSVSFFFVLSGFILAYTYLNATSHSRTADFYRARFARIYPVYLLGFVLEGGFLVRDMLTSNSIRPGSLAVSGILTVLLLQSWVVTFIAEWNVPGWSLSTEAFFYLLFPGAGKLVRKLPATWVAISLLGVTALLFIPAIVNLSALQGRPTAHQLDLLGCSPIFRSPEFLIGVLAGRFFVMKGPWKWGYLLCATSAAGILMLLAGSPPGSLQWWREKVLVILFTAFIFGLAGCTGMLRSFLSYPILVVLGQASYALYILHWPLYRIMLAINGIVRARPHGDPHPGSVFFMVYAAACVVVSIVVLYAIEQPARQYLRRRWK
jgi:peptidoglycan/LPS O-acetylase OafA/YrhL